MAEERFEQTITTVNEHGTTQTPIRRVLVSDIGFVRSFVRTLVTAWVEMDTWALLRADVTLIAPVAVTETHVVRAEFETNPQFGVRVPVQLTEAFWVGGSGEGKATYRGYRRFETTARILPPP